MPRPTTPPDPLPPRAVIGAEALAALAVPARLALLNHLLAAGPRTASECAPVVGETASNCSWHLRALAKVGLVERAPRAPDGDGRTRPWRATAVDFVFSDPADDGPAAAVALTALEVLLGRIDALIRPYVRPIRVDAPDEAGIVQVTLRAFLNPDLHAGDDAA